MPQMTTPGQRPAAPEPQADTRTHDRDETPRQAARADRDYWVDRDWPTEPDDPSDHYCY